MYNIGLHDQIEVTPEVIDQVLKHREEKKQIGMVLIDDKKGRSLGYRIRWKVE